MAAPRQRDVAWRRCGSGGSATARRWRQLGGGAVAVAAAVATARQCDGSGSLAAAAWRRRTALRRQAMDGARARVIDGVTATLRQRNAQW